MAKPNPLTCKHWWIRSKEADKAMCMYCMKKVDIEDAFPPEDKPLPPPQEDQESL